MKTWIIIACGIGASYYFADVRSPHFVENLLAPLLLLIFVLAAVIKLMLALGKNRGGSGGGGNAGIYGGSGHTGGCGGDGGGGDC